MIRELSEGFRTWLDAMVGKSYEVDRLSSDASGRLFYRIRTEDGSYVAMDSAKIPIWPWLDIHDLLASRELPVPKLYETLPEKGWALQEDLGSIRMLDLSGEHYQKALEKALSLLDRMQEELEHDSCSGSVAGRRYFTRSFFMAELEHTLEHLFFRLLEVPEDELTELQSKMRDLCNMLDNGPQAFSHRDFHSANLMYKYEKLVILDWQDARFGPPEYDLVSLIRDSYVDCGDQWKDHASKFIHARGSSNMFRIAMTACQRNLKAAGTFAFQYRAYGREWYLENLPRTMRYLDGYREVCPRLGPLVEEVYRILDDYVGEIDLRNFRESDSPVVTKEQETG
jgi:hypothetical protein